MHLMRRRGFLIAKWAYSCIMNCKQNPFLGIFRVIQLFLIFLVFVISFTLLQIMFVDMYACITCYVLLKERKPKLYLIFGIMKIKPETQELQLLCLFRCETPCNTSDALINDYISLRLPMLLWWKPSVNNMKTRMT